mmetsp:Transcript_7921/g.19470  ORF Transcript_7921/g.19470 Transcript_7921/m.19470 type:complete len:273 (+) Transcript_7921:129-947(+)
MSLFTVYPTSTTLFYARGNRHRGQIPEARTNFSFFVLVILSLALALSNQQREFHSNYGTVSAAVATTALSSNVVRSSRSAMVTMAAGSSRTLIELTNRENESSGEFQFEVAYLDEDDENGLLVLRRANVDIVRQSKSFMEGSCTVCNKAVRVLKNPIIFLVLAGNIASMTGILPPGIAGFLPAAGIFLQKNMKWTTPILGRLGSLRLGKGIFFKLKLKLSKAISNLYKNRSKYSLLSDCLWHVDFDEGKSKAKNGYDLIDAGARSSTYKAIA